MANREQSGAMPGARFVDPRVLQRIGNLDLLARHVVDGFINGLHRAPHFGASIDFAEHRGYVAGDDIRRVDWRLYARTDKYYVKQYDADTNTNFAVLLDISKSMMFGSGGVTKIEYARYLAACLGYMAHRQRDRVGIVTFDEEVVTYVPPSAKHFDVMLHTLDKAEPVRAGRLRAPLDKIAEHFKRRSIVALISDLYEEPDEILEAIKPYRFLGNDIMVFHVLDPAELDFPYKDASRFQDLETGEEVPIVPESLLKQYRELIAAHIDALRTKFSEIRVDYTLVNTARPLDDALFNYLANRERMMRVR
ncbi:MAG TPA: DUF58 domain-containing protein [Vicinamibacterales bacterium]|nr:DUF58 domain-containing protein [Vicinamibacterales bacterium]